MGPFSLANNLVPCEGETNFLYVCIVVSMSIVSQIIKKKKGGPKVHGQKTRLIFPYLSLNILFFTQDPNVKTIRELRSEIEKLRKQLHLHKVGLHNG